MLNDLLEMSLKNQPTNSDFHNVIVLNGVGSWYIKSYYKALAVHLHELLVYLLKFVVTSGLRFVCCEVYVWCRNGGGFCR